MAGAEEWPSELLHVSDAVQCREVAACQQRWANGTARVSAHSSWAPPKANGGLDAGIVATAPTPLRAGCWPSNVQRAPAAFTQGQGFYVAACAPHATNEVRRQHDRAPGATGAVCTRSHQLFDNSTRKCTGTYRPGARQTCPHPMSFPME